MIRGSTGSSLSERLRSFSNRYANDSDNLDGGGLSTDRGGTLERGGGTGTGGGGLISKRHDELRASASGRTREKYDRESQDREKEGSPASDRYRREGSSGRSDVSDRSTSSSSSYGGSNRYGYLTDRSTDRGNSGVTNGTTGSYGSESPLTGRLSTKREARDAFFTKSSEQMSAPKFDPSLLRERERDKEREKEKLAYSGGSSMTSQPQSQAHHNHMSAPGSKEIETYVGFANLPNQVYRKSVKRGFEFTLMVVGESGLGKSTLINSMFLADLYSAEYPGPSLRIKKTVQVENTQVLLKEGGVQLRLTTVDTPGFGDAVDNSNCWQPIIDFIESKYDEYLNAESRVNRKTMPDNRVHCCLYFISPNGHGLKPLDVEFMKRLHDKVNIIPLIAKADTLTPDECREFKKTILNEIAQHKIKIYEFPDADDEQENKLQKKLKDRVPFAVVGSNTVVESQGRRVRGRMYPWGIVEVENLEHNDFIALRNMLIRTYLQDLKDVTNNVHYENFRYNKLASVATGGKNKNTSGKNNASPTPVPSVRRRKVDKFKTLSVQSKSTGHLPNTINGDVDADRIGRPATPDFPSPKTPDSWGSMDSPFTDDLLNDQGTYIKSGSHTLPRPPPRNRHRSRSRHLSSVETSLSNEAIKKRVALLFSLYGRGVNPLIMMEDERKEHVTKMKKMEAEMEQVFEMKVKEKKQKLKDSELDLQRRAEQMKKSLEQQQKELEEKRRAFEKEKMVWEEQQKNLEEQRRRSLENAKETAKKDKKKSLF